MTLHPFDSTRRSRVEPPNGWCTYGNEMTSTECCSSFPWLRRLSLARARLRMRSCLTYFPGTSAFAEGLGIHGLDSIDQNAFARNVLHTGMYGVVVVPLVVMGFWRRGSVLGFERLFRLLGERDRDSTRE